MTPRRMGRLRQFQCEDPVLQLFGPRGDLEVNRILQLRAGANNVLDKDPPIIDNNIVAGGGANTYDAYDHIRPPAVRGVHCQILGRARVEC